MSAIYFFLPHLITQITGYLSTSTIMKLLIMQFSPVHYYFPPFMHKYLSECPISNIHIPRL
jgi:hypothetical protein